ncbi:hypothetical protein ES703_70009 [subsurface metagenome]
MEVSIAKLHFNGVGAGVKFSVQFYRALGAGSNLLTGYDKRVVLLTIGQCSFVFYQHRVYARHNSRLDKYLLNVVEDIVAGGGWIRSIDGVEYKRKVDVDIVRANDAQVEVVYQPR